MTELGNRLKEARLAKNLSLDDVQSITKIQKRYLIGIEEGNYSSMPGNFYVRAFIKQYSEALQLDPDEIFETYKNEIPAALNDDLPNQLSRVKTRKNISEGNSKIFDVLPKILIGIFIIGAASLLYYFLTHHVGSKSNQTANPGNEQVKFAKSAELEKAKTNTTDNAIKNSTAKNNNSAAMQDTGNTQAAVPSPQELTVVQSVGKNSSYELKNADKFVLKLVSKGKTWVNIKNGSGRSFFSGTLTTTGTSSQTVDFTKEDKAVIVVGNAIDTDIYVNDQKLEYAIAPTSVVSQNVTIQLVPKTK
ncbi:helix-turn-helix domain-containing protein [Neobacillus ginsengisoli]|uniref:Cytoskeletal protein RodZ n=1 Tax=Neobacillus ginsengisoli TaxID=904295 RepID=A0ABT9XTF4_9BACI|nr:RodZ domain-containing protein [Neobacillus ginsengisoli]MDQ0198631.1 cytoskeletal protein RodZ [Neobacillus ginsengisoli]